MSLNITIDHRRGFLGLSASFEVPAHGISVIFGPPGTGASFMLAAIAGLANPKTILVDLNGTKLHALPTHRRRIGMVFPDGRLFRHLSVEGNLIYGMARMPKERPMAGVAPVRALQPGEVADLLGLHTLRQRMPATLTPSERQRVAIGRALCAQPRLLLLDDPLATLDAAQRWEMLAYLQRLRAALTIPTLYVTHGLDEAHRLAHFMVLIEGGQMLGAGPLPELAARVDLPLAAHADAASVLSGHIHSHARARGLTAVSCGNQIIDVTLCDVAEEAPVRLRIPAREVMISLDEPRDMAANNVVAGMISAIRRDTTAHAALVELEISGGQLLSRMSLDAAHRLRLEPGQRVLALIKSVSVEVIAG